TKGDIVAILANNSGMARGAVQAVQAAGLGSKKIFIAGPGAGVPHGKYVCEGKHSGEGRKEIKPLAPRAAPGAPTFFSRGEPAPDPNSSSTRVAAIAVHLVTRENVRPLLIDSGFHTENALASCTKPSGGSHGSAGK